METCCIGLYLTIQHLIIHLVDLMANPNPNPKTLISLGHILVEASGTLCCVS
jgi:hypothetical protein